MARRKMWTLLGHSNGEGFAGSSPMIASAPWLADYYTTYYPAVDNRKSPSVVRSKYENIYAWTAKLGWSDVGGTPPVYQDSEGQFLPLTIRSVNAKTSPHPYPSPYNYPNGRSMPCSPTIYNASTTGGGCWSGVELPLSWRLAHYWMDSVYFNKLSIPSTTFLRKDPGYIGVGLDRFGIPSSLLDKASYSWYTPADKFDWDPTSGRLYQSWKNRMTAAAAESALAGDKLDVRFVVLWMGDNDAAQATVFTNYSQTYDTSRVKNFESYYRNFIDKIRQDIVDNDWSSLPAHKISIIGMKIHKNYGATVIQNGMNNAIDNIERDDPYFKGIETNNYEVLSTAGYTDETIGMAGHFSHNGYLAAADDIFDAYVLLETAGEDALAKDNRITLSEVRNRVLTYYERNRTATNATETALNQNINGALFHILNKVGDSAWWLRQIYPIEIVGGPTKTVTLPRYVHRILRIERQSDPGYPLKFEMTGFTDAGRMQILMKESFVGTYNVHFITQPKDLSQDDELIPLPYNLIEWLVVEAAKRLARSSGNTTMLQTLMAEAAELRDDCMRNIAAVRRPANDRLYGQRRLPSRRSYGRRWWGY